MRGMKVHVEKDPKSSLYVAVVPGIRGAHTQAGSLKELRKNMKEVVGLCLEEGRHVADTYRQRVITLKRYH